MTRLRMSLAVVRAAALIAATALLAACSILPEKSPQSLFAPAPRIQADPSWPSVDWQLVVPRPNVPAMLDSARIVVRPPSGELQVYKSALWAQPTPDLVQNAIVHGFEDSGRVAGVARRGEGITGDYILQLDIRRFIADYAGNARPSATVAIGAKLISSNQVIAQRVFHQQVPAATTDVGSVAAAFEQALGAATTQIVGWTLAEGQRHAAQPASDS